MSDAKPYAAKNIDLNQENVVLFNKLRDFPDGDTAELSCLRVLTAARCLEYVLRGANRKGVVMGRLPSDKKCCMGKMLDLTHATK
jgi:hypothetical protein